MWKGENGAECIYDRMLESEWNRNWYCVLKNELDLDSLSSFTFQHWL